MRQLFHSFVVLLVTETLFTVGSLSLVHSSVVEAQDLNLMPQPSSMQLGVGQMTVDQSFSVAVVGPKDGRLERGVHRFLLDLSMQTGMSLNSKPIGAGKGTLVVQTQRTSKEVQEPGEDESYTLEVTESGANLSAANSLGALHGLQTLLQLIGPTSSGFAAPNVTIHDTPRFVWRGLLIDVSRHFIPIEVLKRNLDGMAALKMNVFHWHLSDDQGFRVESKKFPRLQEMSSDGLYYTQEEIRDLISYAQDRGIRVVPEFDMPGHGTAWLVAYPHLSSGPGPYVIERNFGIFDPVMDPTSDSTYKFLDEFIGEMAKIFPDAYFHIGGDEVNGKQWAANPQIQQFMQRHSLKSNQDLQAYFNRRVQQIVAKRGKTMIGWDEVLHPDLPKSVVIQSWRGQDSLATAARQGHRGLLSFGYYVNQLWPASRHYIVDPLGEGAANLTPSEQEQVLGGEACMWAEFVSPENIDSRIWPRTAAIAERLWSPQGVRDLASMYRRMGEVSWRMEWLGLTHYSSYLPMLRRLAGKSDVPALRVLADVVEPIKDYEREDSDQTPLTSATPLNRLVDAVRPESEMARLFSEDVETFVASQCKDATSTARIVTKLSDWRDNQSKLQPLINESFLLKEIEPISWNLSALGAAGLEAMDYIERSALPNDRWTAEQRALLEQAGKPGGQVLLSTVPAIKVLIEASSDGGTCQPRK